MTYKVFHSVVSVMLVLAGLHKQPVFYKKKKKYEVCFLFMFLVGQISLLFHFECESAQLANRNSDALYLQMDDSMCHLPVFRKPDCQTTKYMLQYLLPTVCQTPVITSLSSVNCCHITNVTVPLVCLTYFVLPLSFYLQVQTTERSDWLECPEGAELISLLQDISTSNRCEFCCLNAFEFMCHVKYEFLKEYFFHHSILI